MKTTTIPFRTTALLLLATVYSTSCNTTALWRSTDPNECIEVSFDEMTEEALKEDDFKYHKDDEKQLFFIEKDSTQKFGNYALRVFGTPITTTADACLIGLMAFSLMANETPLESVNWDTTLVEWGYH